MIKSRNVLLIVLALFLGLTACSDQKPQIKEKRSHVENVLSTSCSKEDIGHLLENKWDFEINDIVLKEESNKIKHYDIYVKDFIKAEQNLIKDIVEAQCLHTSNDKLIFILKSRTCKEKYLKDLLNKTLNLDKISMVFKELNYTYYKIIINGNTPLNQDYAKRLQKGCL